MKLRCYVPKTVVAAVSLNVLQVGIVLLYGIWDDSIHPTT